MRALLGCALVALALSACATAQEGGTAADETPSVAAKGTGQTGPSDASKYSGEPSDRPSVYRDGQPWPFATTREQIERSEWSSRSFYPPEYCWVVHSETWDTPQYWDIRRWCDKREMQDEFL